MAGRYDIGDRPVVTAVFSDVRGGTGVSTAVTFTVRKPDNTVVTYSSPHAQIASGGTNRWKLTMSTLDQSGTYYVRAESTAGLQAAEEVAVPVDPSRALGV